MLKSLVQSFLGSSNARYIKTLQKEVQRINALEPQIMALSDAELMAKSQEFRERLHKGESEDSILCEAFACVREASKRALGLRHYDVQLIAGIVLHRGIIAEAKTGEGKTLTATLPIYLNALSGKGAHVITVNDYLAKRDAMEMGEVYAKLGLTTGVITSDMGLSEDADYDQLEQARRDAYACDVAYATNNEIGFDFLRDNMKQSKADMVQRGFNFGIVDEVDSILIDEARTPLIISGPAVDSSELYKTIDSLIRSLEPECYEIDEKDRSATLTETGVREVEKRMIAAGLLSEDASLFDSESITMLHHANTALRAHQLFKKDTAYIVRSGQVILIDEFTGRAMAGRRLSEGLHQALEAKEGVRVQRENITIASITFQNLFRGYKKLAGMTGTAATEAQEFSEIYGLDVVEIPTNVPVQRMDKDDEVYRTMAEKYKAVVAAIEQAHKRGQPTLVGTVSIDKSEYVSALLKKRGIKHQVLNARYHEQEAQIIADAGVPGKVTIATNMAGRGTDIQLGGNLNRTLASVLEGLEGEKRSKREEEVRAEHARLKKQALEAGGLLVIATERHESRRIDNQLRGRSGRQGDPGESRFYLCLEDDLLRIFGSERMDGMLTRLGLKEDEAIIHPWINKAVEKAQTKVEGRNFDIRKQLLKFDNVMNDQRKVVFQQRLDIMDAEDVRDIIASMRGEALEDLVYKYIPEGSYPAQWDAQGLQDAIREGLRLDVPIEAWAQEEGIAEDDILDRLTQTIEKVMAQRAVELGPEAMRSAEKQVLLHIFDQRWRDHLQRLIQLRDGIHLRGYGQRDPLAEYKRESFGLFENMMERIRFDVTAMLLRLSVRQTGQMEAEAQARSEEFAQAERDKSGKKASLLSNKPAADGIDPNDPETWGKVGRNSPCPCGSGNKFKHCHGRLN